MIGHELISCVDTWAVGVSYGWKVAWVRVLEERTRGEKGTENAYIIVVVPIDGRSGYGLSLL